VYRFREHSARKTFDVQVFDNHNSVFVDDVTRQFMLKVVALMENLSLNFGNQANRLLPTLP
jgi:hypothetical protein